MSEDNRLAAGAAPIDPVAKAIDAAGYSRAYLEEASVIQMAAAIDVAMGPIEGREQNPMCVTAVERRKHSRRLARVAFWVIPNFALNLPRPPTPSPTGTELALIEAKRHISRLTSFWMENPHWYKAAEDARAFISGIPAEDVAGEKAGLTQASDSLARISSLREALSVEQLTVMILAARREPGIWRADVQAKFLAEKINTVLSSHPEDGGIREALEKVGPGLLVLRNMCRTMDLHLGEERAKELIEIVRAALNPAPLPIGEERGEKN